LLAQTIVYATEKPALDEGHLIGEVHFDALKPIILLQKTYISNERPAPEREDISLVRWLF